MFEEQNSEFDLHRHTLMTLRNRLRAVIQGRNEVIDLVIIAFFADGHVLLEDYPGSGKTTLARALGESLDPNTTVDYMSSFRRIQFTPDLLPSDITGTNIFDAQNNLFTFRKGPLFSHIVLADEINRTSPKVQSAMLEAMAEKQITNEERSFLLDELFFVIATQNPADVAGTYPLPTPQLDRFLFRIQMENIAKEDEFALLSAYPQKALERAQAFPLVSREAILRARYFLQNAIYIHPAIREALVDLASQLRSNPQLPQGISTRALLMALPALQARALLYGRAFTTPDDFAKLAYPLLNHRLAGQLESNFTKDLIYQALTYTVERLSRLSVQWNYTSQ